ncbi:hypothetical protein [Acinetobacter beijerinckii]|uniref:hypothetical protein n=1 Tax=Acinetobacter beijerinckii TaxID=262668 RepID=UPI004054A1F2
MNEYLLNFFDGGFSYRGVDYHSNDILVYVPVIIDCLNDVKELSKRNKYFDHSQRVELQKVVLIEVIQIFKNFEESEKNNLIGYLNEALYEYLDFLNTVNESEVFANELNATINSVSIKIKKIFDSEIGNLYRLQLMYAFAKECIIQREAIERKDLELSSTLKLYSEKSIELAKYENEKKNKPAVVLYDDIHKDFSNLEKRNRAFFIIAILLTLFLTIGYDPLIRIGENIHSLACSINSSKVTGCDEIIKVALYPFNSETLKFITFKLAILIVGISLTTYFLRLSSFYQLKQEQAKQTKLELSAFPDFVSGMEPSIANNLRQELALKYFGKEIDKTMIEKNGDLLQEQIKAGTDLIKASAEMVKNVKPSSTKEEEVEKKE